MEYKIVLMYHDVVNELHPKSGFQKVGALQYTLNSRVFFEQVTRFNGDYIVFSFDDGGESFYTVIAPILEHNNQKGIFFISSKSDSKNSIYIRLRSLKIETSKGFNLFIRS